MPTRLSSADEIMDVLIAAGIAVASAPGSGWLVRTGRLVNTPDRVIACTDTGGTESNPKWLLDYITFQVLVRGDQDAYGITWTKANDVKDALLGIDPFVTPGGVRWDSITMMGNIGFAGYDENSRPIFSANYRGIIEPPVSALSHREAL